jgi:pimeloyl-ACP methyl ester carboxylesterase
LITLFGLLGCNLPLSAAGRPATPTPFAPATSQSTASPAGIAAPSPLNSPEATAPPEATLPQPQAPLPTIPYQTTFRQAPCDFPVPAGYDLECGYLVVPENRTRPDSPPIRLHVAVFRSRAEQPAPYPVVHLAGGPGSSSLMEASYLFQNGLDAVLDRRDLILFDQRGAGFSQPRLDCPEREQLTPRLLDGSLTSQEADQAVIQVFLQCRDRLSEAGNDLAAYTSAASADDLNDLRLALGYHQINLYGISYGTRLALTMMRDHPEAVHSAVLDSAYPLQVNLYTALAPNAQRAFNIFFDKCQADPQCSASYPDLEQSFYDLVDRLNAAPVTIRLAESGQEYTVQLDGDLLVDVLFVGLYNPRATAFMPEMIYAVQRGDYEILEQRLWLYFASTTALGMQLSVQCAEEFPFNSPQEAFALAEGVRPQIAAFFPESVQRLFAVCREWAPARLDRHENQPVHSAIPALVLAGELDPITPPEWGRLVAEDLANAVFYEFPGNGHWVTRSSACAVRLALAFWDDPDSPLDSSCVGQPN